MFEAITLVLLVVFFAFLFVFALPMIGWAKKGRKGAFVVGMMVNMFLPDPKIQQTLAVIEIQKSEKAEASDEETDK